MAGPATIGRYRLIRRVGAGGMGVVYEALDSRDDQRVALKVLLPHAAEEAEGILRFKREFRALARLRHPNIVRVIDAGIENDVPFIAMEFLEGKDIRRHLRALPEGAVRDRETRRCLRQIFGALAHIHARRIVHRDMKPENILVTGDGRVKLMDFGVARLLRAPTNSSGLLGTFAYMAPEQVTGGEIDGRSDLYALGVLLFELVTGEYPFPVEPPAAALHHHVNTIPDSVLRRKPDADPNLAALTAKLLEKDPMDRLQTAEEAFGYLDDEESVVAPVETSLPGQLFSPRFVGRSEDLAFLERAVDAAAASHGRLILIEGPTGIGKSRLVQELRGQIRRRTNVLMGQCAAERTQAYGPIQAVLDEIEAIAARTPPDVLKKIVGRDAALVHAVSPKLARLGGPATTEHLDPNERKVRLHKAIVGVTGRLALTRPVTLVIEDVHWADSASLELLWDASRTLLAPRPGGAPGETVCPVLIILTRRSLAEGPDFSEQVVRRLDERALLERLAIGPLEPAAVNEMVRTMTGAQRPLPEAVAELARITHGRPLMVREALDSWVDEGVLERHRGAWHWRGQLLDVSEHGEESRDDTPLALHAVAVEAAVTSRPPSAEPASKSRRPRPAQADEVALAKLARLTAPSRALLERLALLGRLLSAELVSAVSGLDEEEAFLDAMDELVRTNLLVEDVSHDGVRYRFYHEGFREAVARAISPRRREELHAFVARRLERKFRTRRAELAHVLSRHFRAGGAPDRAVRYLVMMASSAAARGDLEAALRRLSDATAIVDERPRTPASATRRLGLLVRQIDLLLDFGRAREALDRADPEAVVGARAPEVQEAELMLRRAAALFALGKLDETLATLLTMSGRAPTRSLGARSLELEGRARMARGEYAQARAVLQAARDIATDAGLVGLARDLDSKIGVVLLHQGDYAGALEKLDTGLARARTRGDTRAAADLLGHIGMVHAARGNDSEALANYREAIELADARGVRAELGRWSGELGRLMTELGDYEGARAKLIEALEIAHETGSSQSEATWRGELGRHYLEAGRPDLAVAELNRCLAISRDIGYARYEAWAELHLGRAAIEHSYDDFEEAFAHLDAGLELASEIGNEELEILGLLYLYEVERARGDDTAAKNALEHAERRAAATQNRRLERRVRSAAR